AANVTITDERQDLVDYVAPSLTHVKEGLVKALGAPAIESVDDLSGQTVHVRQISAYYQSLQALNGTLAQRNKTPVVVKFVPDTLEDEDVLEMVNAGLVKITVVDDHLANFWKQIFPGITIHGDAAVRTGGEIAMAVRKGSPQLKAQLDALLKAHGKGTAFGNLTLRKYLQNVRYAKSATSDAEIAKFN